MIVFIKFLINLFNLRIKIVIAVILILLTLPILELMLLTGYFSRTASNISVENMVAAIRIATSSLSLSGELKYHAD